MNKAILMMIGVWLSFQAAWAEGLDPTRPAMDINGPLVAPTFKLDAIVIANDRKIAVINGVAKKVGEEILGERVTAIYEDTVQLEGANGRMILFLFGKPIKHLLKDTDRDCLLC